MFEVSLAQQIAAWLLPVLLAITVHETAHGWVARRFGDKTAEMQGRLTLNPLKHIDPVGTILVPGLMLLLPGGFVFGWAKPVPVDWRNFKRPKQDMAWVAAAGPISNLLMALGWALMARVAIGVPMEVWVKAPLLFMGVAGVFINTILMVLNLLPLPPLDGGRVLTGLLPSSYAYRFARIEPYGFFILVALLVTGVLGSVMWPFVSGFLGLFANVAGMQPGDFQSVLRSLMRS
ncbi:FIG004556: membrane metalloprotease [hydrothermal vent metagenome]|uniref:FIG004556: membrane metalloprotease n=1 Tax=hydrothermal vent metagenome TaxID=652676 RepID=A0A3B0Z4Y2_9ZZZZ